MRSQEQRKQAALKILESKARQRRLDLYEWLRKYQTDNDKETFRKTLHFLNELATVFENDDPREAHRKQRVDEFRYDAESASKAFNASPQFKTVSVEECKLNLFSVLEQISQLKISKDPTELLIKILSQ
jgi:hypothetical protein